LQIRPFCMPELMVRPIAVAEHIGGYLKPMRWKPGV
jgi:hypothetical protein